MWSNVISIDKSYDREIDFIKGKLLHTKELSSCTEESKDRIWLYLASICEKQDDVEDELLSIMQDVILSYIKMRYFQKSLHIGQLNHAKCALLSAIVHFDREFEENIVSKSISQTFDYNVDGLLNFRLRALKDSWKEISEVANRLLDSSVDDDDLYDISSFITGSEGKKSRLKISSDNIFNLTKKIDVEVLKIFDNKEYNMLFAIISQKPIEIIIDNSDFSTEFFKTLKSICKVA